jgi:holo-[acyl-carrier protein] synthase
VEHYAARFAAKEALLKALGTGLRDGSLQEMETVNDALGKPVLTVTGRLRERLDALGVGRIHVTLSHTRETAMAVVVLEGH